MTDWVPWFQYQLQASADGFAWALGQIPPALLEQLPPDPGYLGTWTPLRHIWHVTEYERCLALPAVLRWLDPAGPAELPWADDDDAWAAADKSPKTLLAAFRSVRQAQIDLLPQLTGVDWLAPRDTLWGDKPLAMVVTKTFQHTYEHGDTLLRMGLWWETILAEIAAQAVNAPTGDAAAASA
jgi:hypothetical protein